MSENTQSKNEQLSQTAPSTPQLCMGTVRDYGSDRISKVEAVKSIHAAFAETYSLKGTPQDQINVAIGTYIDMLDQHDDAQRVTAGNEQRSGKDDNLDSRAEEVEYSRSRL